ncbi:hypothetical protein P43SY_007643 [Pythium insidiosum]|uniref:Uncharacterized protein n=1 Tax=Pythium insidiosum TaxID=114742 RepID=A0AAD5Q314_PYTIN|nr:hypothetical protein P43SY_007643 [Pythium insidiosum]
METYKTESLEELRFEHYCHRDHPDKERADWEERLRNVDPYQMLGGCYVELRMEDMRLKSGESAGRLSVLVFHLVNPLCEDVPSSATVSPTRQDWLFEATTGMLARAKLLPLDLQRSIESFLSNVGIPMDSDLTAEHS